MAGHSKWNNIKRKKEKTDSQKAKVFTKIGREIQVIVREGGANPDSNGRLRDVIAKAKSLNVPNDNINRLIQKAQGANRDSYEEVIYEGYGPGGLAVIVTTLTDNRNRTASNMRHCFDKYGAGLGTSGCTSYLFEKKGVLQLQADEDQEELILVGPIEDYFIADGETGVQTAVADFAKAREYFESHGIPINSAQLSYIPSTTVELTQEADVARLEQLLNALDDDDDVQDYCTNLEE